MRRLEWYERQFPASVFNRTKKSGEAAPYYLFHPAVVAERVANALPDVKLIALLRDPTVRAFSHFQMSVFKGNETILDFEAALAAENERLQRETESLKSGPDYFSLSHQKHSYYARGLYCQQLEHWMRFFPRSQLHIIQSEWFFDDPQAELDKPVLFLGWDGFEYSKLQPLNEGNFTPLDAAVRKRLAQQYRESNQDLEVLLEQQCNGS